LSSFYLDIIKDRLYVEQADGQSRRSAQTACWYILDTLTRLTAPILSFTAEQVSDHYQKNKTASIHLQAFNELRAVSASVKKGDVEYEQLWDVLKNVRSAILKAIEELREQGEVKHSLEARVTVYFDPTKNQALEVLDNFFAAFKASGQTVESFFKEFLIVSQFSMADSVGGLKESAVQGVSVAVETAQGDKCPRCWNWQETTHEHKLCARCQAILR